MYIMIVGIVNREVSNMCVKLEELSKLTVEKLYDQYPTIFEKPPINIELLLNKLKVPFYEQDFRLIDGQIKDIRLPEQADDVFGAVSCVTDKSNPANDTVNIFVNHNDTYNRKRFTLAHELGHCMIDAKNLQDGFIELRSKIHESDPKEIKVNTIAAEILIPEHLLRIEYNKLFLPVLQLLAHKFRVSEHVMQVRLQELKMEYVSI